MASVNAHGREVSFKIVYYGAGLSGKTTNLQHIHAASREEARGKMVSLATPVDRTLYFDFLPVRLPRVQNLSVRLQLFTVPGQVYYNATRRLVLSGVDGVVFVADSQAERLDADLEALQNLRDNLREHGRDLGEIPLVVQYNKRDMPTALPVDDLQRGLNTGKVPWFESIATSGAGVFETMDQIARLVIEDFQSEMPKSSRSLPQGFHASLASAMPPAGPIRMGSRPEITWSPRGTPGSAPRIASADLIRKGGSAVDPVDDVTFVPPGGDEHGWSVPPSDPIQGTAFDTAVDIEPPIDPPGELAAREVEPRESGIGISLVELFADRDRSEAYSIERAIRTRDFAIALELCDMLGARILAHHASTLATPSTPAPTHPARVAELLGVDAERYRAFRRVLREGGGDEHAVHQNALQAYIFLASLRPSHGALANR